MNNKDYQEVLNKAYELISDLDFGSQLKCAEPHASCIDSTYVTKKFEEAQSND